MIPSTSRLRSWEACTSRSPDTPSPFSNHLHTQFRPGGLHMRPSSCRGREPGSLKRSPQITPLGIMTLIPSRAATFVYPRDDLTLPQFILDTFHCHPTRPFRPADVPCLIDEDTGRAVSIQELEQRSHTLANAMKARWDIGAGDIVSICAPNHVDYGVLVWAVHRLGGIVATHAPTLTSDELVHQLQIADPVLVVAHPENLPTVLAAIKKVDLCPERVLMLDGHNDPDTRWTSVEDVLQRSHMYRPYVEYQFTPGQARTYTAFLCFSSGTTGNPKAVCISHYNVICNVVQAATFNRVNEAYAAWEDRRFRPGDRCAGVLPLYHIYGLVVNLHFMIYSAMTIVVSKKFKFETLLQSIQRYRITHLMIVPPQAVLFCKHPSTKEYDLSSVRYCMVAAAPVSASLTAQLLEIFPGVHLGQGYGMTETCATVSMFPVTQQVGTLGSGGQLVSGTIAKIVKADGTLATVGEPGELYVKGPQVALGYYMNEQASNETFVDGWVRTGDEVVIQDNGDLFVTDRIKELIKVKGNQVAPSELEGHLLNHPDVADAAVIGIHDDYAGELPYAFIVLKPAIASYVGGDEKRAGQVRVGVYKHIASVTSRYKWLDGGIEFIDAIPKNASGKILRRVLRERSAEKRLPLKARAQL